MNGISISVDDYSVFQDTWAAAAQVFQAIGWAFAKTWVGYALLLAGAVLVGLWLWRVVSAAAK